jgi:uncharacterized protein (DUF2252 family)
MPAHARSTGNQWRSGTPALPGAATLLFLQLAGYPRAAEKLLLGEAFPYARRQAGVDAPDASSKRHLRCLYSPQIGRHGSQRACRCPRRVAIKEVKMKQKLAPLLLMLAGLVPAIHAHAASSRPAWVTAQVYNYNHQFAATGSADLVTKISTMAGSAFLFYRGSDHIFFQDMATLLPSSYASIQTGYTWLGGDTHIGNFGAMRDSGAAQVFGVSDFDEGYLGQFVWDVRRLAVSMILAGRENGLADSDITTAINTMVGAYLDKMDAFKGTGDELSFQLKSGNTSGVVQDTISAGGSASRSSLLSKYTQLSGASRVFQTSAQLLTVSAGTYGSIVSAMSGYIGSIASSKRYASSYYAVKDIRQKLGSGVGSLGKLRYYILLEGPSSSTSDDVILEMKQTTGSSVAQVDSGRLPASSYSYNEGCRVARTLKAQLINADVLVGCTNAGGVDYYLHEKSPYQQDFDTTALATAGKLNTAASYLGVALASAHALADQDYDAAVVSYSIDKQVADGVTSKSSFKAEIVGFAYDYATQVNLDWLAFVAARDAGTPLY